MVWSYTAYILHKYFEKLGKSDLKFSELVDFVFITLGRKYRLTLHDGKQDLFMDLEYLKDLGAISITISNEEIQRSIISLTTTNKQKLQTIAKGIEQFPKRMKIKLIEEYMSRIDNAISEIISPVQ